jgi:class I fructose-bisphosphate aldolase
MYTKLTSNHPIDLCRYQVLNCFSGRIGMINSGGESKGETDLAEAIKTAVINKRAGGAGMIMGRKAFQRPFSEGVNIIHAVQEIYLSKEITLA